MIRFGKATALFLVLVAVPLFGDKPPFVDITWMSISNIYYEVSGAGILTDGYITRIPQSAFYGGGGGLGNSHSAYKPDVAAVSRVLDALGGPAKVTLLLTGHAATSIILSTRQRGPA